MNINKVLPYIYAVGGAIALYLSFVISIEKFYLASEVGYIPPCSFNPLISCITIMKTWQASVFGFPNPFIGIAGFAIVLTIGMAMLSGASFGRRFWQGAQVGVTFAIGFIFWLFFQSVFRIGALCPFCMVVWAATIPIFWYTTVYNLEEGNLSLPKVLSGVKCLLLEHHLFVLMSIYLVIVLSILIQFWSFWSSLI